MGGVGLGPIGVLPPQNLRPEVTCKSQIFSCSFSCDDNRYKVYPSMWCQYLSMLLPVNHCPLHVAFRIAGVEREGLATNVALATSLCIEGDYEFWEVVFVFACASTLLPGPHNLQSFFAANSTQNYFFLVLGSCPCLCIHVVDVGSLIYTPDSLWHLWW